MKKRAGKKINGLRKQNDKMHEICTAQRKNIMELRQANSQLGFVLDSWLAAIAAKHGERREEDGELLGYRIAVPADDVATALRRYTVKAGKDGKTGEYVIGVFPREDAKNEP